MPRGLSDGRTGGCATLGTPSGTSSATAATPGTSQAACGWRALRGRSGIMASSRTISRPVSASTSATAATVTSGLLVRPSQPTAPTTASALRVNESSSIVPTSICVRAPDRHRATG